MERSHRIIARMLMIVACLSAIIFFISRPQGTNEVQFALGLLAGLLITATVIVFRKTR